MSHVATAAGSPRRHLSPRFLTRSGVILLSGMICFGSIPANATDVYRWIDANGVPSYSERPPEGFDYVKLKLNGSGSKPSTSLPPPFPTKPAPEPTTNPAGTKSAKKSPP